MTEPAALLSRVEAFAKARVLCVGDVMLDRYIAGTVERISPEAPIPVLRVGRETAMLGGAGNVVRNLVALGTRVRFAAAVGEDAAAAEIRALLAEHPTVEAALITEAGRQTAIKTRFLAGTQQMMRVDRETVRPLGPDARAALLEAVSAALAGVQVVVLSDYGKGVLADDVAAVVIAAARDAGKPVVVDPKGSDYSRYRGAGVLTPNRRELGEAAGMAVDGDDAIAAAARRLIETCTVDAVLATRSQDGMTLVTAAGDTVHLAAEAREVFDVSGAGDTVVATLAAGLGAGAGLAEAAALANAAAGIVVGKVGTAAVYAADLMGALRHQDVSSAEAKVMALAPAVDRIATWRRKDLSIGFTNGCFDLLHPGHIALLAQAKGACDRLVVGLNSDSSVTRLKGQGRPIQSEAARAQVLASLASVDMVVVFADDTPITLIEAIRPDVLVKGADYTEAEVVGGDLVRGWGGRVLLAELIPDHSTTATIARIAK